MSSKEDAKDGLRSGTLPPQINDKPQFEETTAFGDPVPKAGVYSESELDENGDQFKKNPFLDPDVADHWAAVYEKSRYECRHEFDPAFTWSEEEEKKLVRRLDWRVCLWAVSCDSISLSISLANSYQ